MTQAGQHGGGVALQTENSQFTGKEAGGGLKGPRESSSDFIHTRRPQGEPFQCRMWNTRAVASAVPANCRPSLVTLS